MNNTLKKGLISVAVASLISGTAYARGNAIASGDLSIAISTATAYNSDPAVLTSDSTTDDKAVVLETVYVKVAKFGTTSSAKEKVYLKLPVGLEFVGTPTVDANSSVFNTGLGDVNRTTMTPSTLSVNGVTNSYVFATFDSNATAHDDGVSLAFSNLKAKITNSALFTSTQDINYTIGAVPASGSTFEHGPKPQAATYNHSYSLATSPVISPANLPTVTLAAGELNVTGAFSGTGVGTMLLRIDGAQAGNRNLRLTLPTGLSFKTNTLANSYSIKPRATAVNQDWNVTFLTDTNISLADRAGAGAGKSIAPLTGAETNASVADYFTANLIKNGTTTFNAIEINTTNSVTTTSMPSDVQVLVDFNLSEMNQTATLAAGDLSFTVDGNLSLDSNYRYTKIKFATAASDGVNVSLRDSNTSVYKNITVVPGRTQQRIADVNLTEYFGSSFISTANANTVTLTLPTGYTFSADPYIEDYNQSSTTTNHNNANSITTGVRALSPTTVGSNVATVTFAASASNIAIGSNVNVQTIVVGGNSATTTGAMRIAVPSTAVDGDVVTLTLGGTMFSSTKTLSATTINVATVRTTTATLTEVNTTAPVVATSAQTLGGDTFIAFDVNESFGGTIAAGSTVTAKISAGVFSKSSATTTPTSLNGLTANTAPAFSDGNTTITWTVDGTSTTTAGGLRFFMPDVNASTVGTEGNISATIAGTAGVSGTINIGQLSFGSSTKASNMVAVTAGTVDTYTGELVITEGIPNGLTAGGTFKLIAPKGISFSGGAGANGTFKHKGTLASSAAATTVTEATTQSTVTSQTIATTFNTNDTLEVVLPAGFTASTALESTKIVAQISVAPDSTDGLKNFQVVEKSGSGVIATQNLSLVYVGTVPTLTGAADVTVEPGKTTTVVPTNATGTVTYASANTAIATVDTAGTVTVDANATTANTVIITATDSLTAQAASTTITVGTATPVDTTLSGDITLAAGWNFISSPVDGDVDLASVAAAGCSQVHTYDSTANWYGAAVTTGTLSAGASAVAYCDGTTTTVAYTGITANTTAFSMTSAITAASKGTVPTTHAAAAVGAKYAVVGTPTATTVADVVAAGAAGVMIYNATTQAYNFSSAYTGFTPTAADTDAIAAGTSFIIQTAE